MNKNTVILALALTLVANGAYAAGRSAGSRNGGKPETRVLNEKERQELREKEKEKNPNAVDNSKSRQTKENAEANALISQALNGSKSITSKDGLLALSEAAPLSKLPKLLNDLALVESTLLNRRDAKVEDADIRITSSALRILDAYGKEVLSNPDFKTQEMKQELADFIDVLSTEIKEAISSGKWPKDRLENSAKWLDVLLANAAQGPKKGTELNAKFTWEELLKRCKKGKA